MGFLSPPWSFTSSEVCFNPGNKHHLPIINICMSQCQGLCKQENTMLVLVSSPYEPSTFETENKFMCKNR